MLSNFLFLILDRKWFLKIIKLLKLIDTILKNKFKNIWKSTDVGNSSRIGPEIRLLKYILNVALYSTFFKDLIIEASSDLIGTLIDILTNLHTDNSNRLIPEATT